MLENSVLCIDAKEVVKAKMTVAGNVLFGISPENVSSVLTEAAFKSICERFYGIMVQDIQMAYDSFLNDKKIYTLELADLLRPIESYWKSKQCLLNEIDGYSKKEYEEALKISNFRKRAEQKYAESLEAGEWIGDEFEASAIAPDYTERFTADEKLQMWHAAQYEGRDRRRPITSLDQFELNKPPVPDEKIYARILIEQCISRKYHRITE